MWPSPAPPTRPHPNYGLPPEFFFVAPASSFHHHHSEAAAATTINFDPHSLNASSSIGMIPLLTATPCIGDEDLFNNARSRGSGMQLWQPHQEGHNSPAPAYLIKPTNLLQTGGGGSSSRSAATCEDCGNQAKKDCPHRRCRTCCKSRNYDCTTHLKSTWVPAARRRERQLLSATSQSQSQSQSTSGTKKPRLGETTTASHTSTCNTTQARSFDTSSSHQDASLKGSLPGQVRAPAVFKCVRVTAMDDGEDEYAYQAVVKIGGHVFKGFLYDQGVEGRDGLPNLSELHLGGGGGGGGGRNGGSSSPPPPPPPAAVVDNTHTSHDIYGGAGGMLGGSTYGIGNPIN